MADFYYFGAERLKSDPVNWVYYDWVAGDSVDQVLAGTDDLAFIEQLEFIPQERLEQLFAEKDAAAKLPDSALVLAYRKVANRASWTLDLKWRNGYISNFVEGHRPFVIRAAGTEERYGGGLSGRLDVQPHFVGNELRLTVAIPRESYYADYCSWAAQIATGCNRSAWLHHEFVISGGKLIESVRLRRGDETIAMTELPGPAADRYLFTADLGSRELAGVQAEIDLALRDQRLTFAFPLFYGEFAKQQRLQSARIAELETRLAAAPSDVPLRLELARALQAHGDVDGAWRHYAALLAEDPSQLDLWFAGSDMYAAAAMPARSAELLQEALAINPDNIDLMFTLGAMTYFAGDYAEAKRRFRAVVDRAPDDMEARSWEAYAAFLSEDWASVNDAYGAIPEAHLDPKTRLLSLIAMAKGADGKLDFAQFDEQQKALVATPSGPSSGATILGTSGVPIGDLMQTCYADFYGAYRLEFESKASESQAAFDRAAQFCPKTSFEHRAAIMQLAP
jgi:tetratricopeptide (TPR) repeat protein